MPRKKETLTLSIPPGTKEQLEGVARRLNILWGNSPSISGLLVAIAQGQVETGKPFTLNPSQVHALQQVIKALVDSGQMAEAKTVVELLLAKGKLESPLRKALVRQISHDTEAWRRVVDLYIENQQPFHLMYTNSQGEDEEFNVQYGQIHFRERRFYLEAWCEEGNPSEQIPELQHNRCFRLDRIVTLLEYNGTWRKEGLGYIKVQLHFKGEMVKAYEPKEDDLENEVIGDIRQVVRKVTNPFWLVREVFHYGNNCEIVAPESVRNLFKDKLRTMCQQYDLPIEKENFN
ncbi:helix-turn-helix transcriptional regulator [Spirulina subsalsa]|uniref:helix-turn-helix transcriptional regulator n=1 Tax=Spirulina subsalsa TaxID=54311 RepID=UPI0002F238A1|nr:WYL domain-containing protein [Spirulina subsalsa]